MPSETGYWNPEEAKDNHDFSYKLAKWIGQYLKDKKAKIIDFGAGTGEYIRYLHDIGFEDLLGIEGDADTITEFGNKLSLDLTTKIALPQAAKIGICLEVGEHIPEEHLSTFIDNLCLWCKDKIILSWGVPGQDGYGHLSCRHNIWVAREMEKRGWKLNYGDSLDARSVIEERFSYFRNTIMIYEHSYI